MLLVTLEHSRLTSGLDAFMDEYAANTAATSTDIHMISDHAQRIASYCGNFNGGAAATQNARIDLQSAAKMAGLPAGLIGGEYSHPLVHRVLPATTTTNTTSAGIEVNSY